MQIPKPPFKKRLCIKFFTWNFFWGSHTVRLIIPATAVSCPWLLSAIDLCFVAGFPPVLLLTSTWDPGSLEAHPCIVFKLCFHCQCKYFYDGYVIFFKAHCCTFTLTCLYKAKGCSLPYWAINIIITPPALLLAWGIMFRQRIITVSWFLFYPFLIIFFFK